MGKIIAFANQKGGVGKTTSAVSVAAALGLLGKRTLLVDADSQGNASSGVGIAKKDLKLSLYDVIIGRSPAMTAVIATEFENLFVLPSNVTLAAAEFEIVSSEGREYRLKNALDPIRSEFDYIIIDCPPSIGILTINSLAACDGVVIPMQCEYYALEGLSQLMMTIRQVKRLYNPRLDITGILITMFNGRLNLSSQVLSELKKYYAGKIFSSPVPRNVKVSESPGYGMPIFYYDKNNKACAAYTSIAKELMERV